MILLSHATGNENVRQTALAFWEAGLLQEFWTCINWDPESAIARLLPRRIRAQLQRRSFPPTLRPITRVVPLREMARLLAGRLSPSQFSGHETGLLSIDAVLRELDRRVAARLRRGAGCEMVYAYEDGALETFRAAKERDLRRVYDLPIGYWRAAEAMYSEEREREPEWAATLTGFNDSEAKLARKEEEMELAEHIVVASSFTKRTLAAAPSDRAITVARYGSPPVVTDDLPVRTGRLRVLFAGSLGQRKGLSYLLTAVASLGRKVELTLLGRKVVDDCAPLEQAVRTHHWIPSLSRDDLLRVMQQHDVLVLPSLFEGFGHVILEAMSQGVVVVTTANTAGPDVIEDGLEGFIVPIRSPAAIAEKLDLLASNPELTHEMRLAARCKAGRCNWEDYRATLVRMATEMIVETKKIVHATAL